ncbi:MAG: FliA/WhiG family RNA polymerase sigma factor [Myxococcales bacterium]|nr:FliA/WhiG family RNA polymerase sigma factor [Myxococcales bacterium]
MNNFQQTKRDNMIIEHAVLVDKIAKRIVYRLPPNVELDDLKSAGFIGLIDAIEKYSDDKGTPFKVYAEIRIRGAIMDELRAQDWVPRSVRDRHNKLQEAERNLQESLGRKPSDSELAGVLDISIEDLHKMRARSEIKSLLSLEDLKSSKNQDGTSRDALEMMSDPKQITPDLEIERNDEYAMLEQLMQRLKEKQRLVLRLYYFEDMKLKEIGVHLSITESRVSQILSEALSKLKVMINKLEKGEL